MSRIVLADTCLIVINTIDKKADFGTLLYEGCYGLWDSYAELIFNTYKKTGEITFRDIMIADEYLSRDKNGNPNLNEHLGINVSPMEIHDRTQEAYVRMMFQVSYARNLVWAILNNEELLKAKDKKEFSKHALKAAWKLTRIPSFNDLEDYEIYDAVDWWFPADFEEEADEFQKHLHLFDTHFSNICQCVRLSYGKDYDENDSLVYI